MDFHSLFVGRTESIMLGVGEGGSATRSRIGGHAPEYFHQPQHIKQLSHFRYLMTLGDRLSNFLGGQELSILVHNRFTVYCDDTDYPNIGIECVVHPPSPPSRNSFGRIDTLREGQLVELKANHEEAPPPYLVRIGGFPNQIQKEPSYERRLQADGFSFVFQFDENGYPNGFISGDYLFGFGALYVYGKTNGHGGFATLTAGYTQFS